MTPEEIRQKILERIPPGSVIPEHTDEGHFYRIGNNVYPSVTGKLQMLKDPSISQYQMNRAKDYIYAHYKEFTDENVMDHLEIAAKQGIIERDKAGYIGTDIHQYREDIFTEWIKTGKEPEDYLAFIPPEKHDVRAVSGLRALKKFVDDYHYVPVMCELLVYSHKYKTAGTLDDIGLLRWPIRKGNKNCEHEITKHRLQYRCMKCDYAAKPVLALMDLKTSNRFKDHYFLQVAMYYDFLRKLVPGLKINKAFILKVSKENGTYEIEDLKQPTKIAEYAKATLRLSQGVDFISNIRKDNQKNVAEITI